MLNDLTPFLLREYLHTFYFQLHFLLACQGVQDGFFPVAH